MTPLRRVPLRRRLVLGGVALWITWLLVYSSIFSSSYIDRKHGLPASGAFRQDSTDATPSPTRWAAASPLPSQEATPLMETLTDLPPIWRPTDGGSTLDADYECVGWRQTTDCTPDGPRDPANDRDCDTSIHAGPSGYCEYRHRHTNVVRRVLPLHCGSLHKDKEITCRQASELLAYGQRTLAYEHDTAFSFDANQHEALASLSVSQPKPSLMRGISMVVYESILGTAYTSVRNLRDVGCTLPVEMWYRADETKRDHPILKELVAKHGVFLRELTDPRATQYYTKLFAVFYSAFDSVLLLDADNFAVRDPEYLFETVEFQQTGAMFWPDFWQPSSAVANVHARSILWQVFGLQYVDMFEQESGQVLVNRRKHLKAMNAMMYYAVTLPRVHEELHMIWGDKDLFRLAWMKTQSSFHYVSRPPGSAGRVHEESGRFCGLTIVQYDPQGDTVFLHRNAEKLAVGHPGRRVWSHLQEFKSGSPVSEYVMGWSHIFNEYQSCWGHDTSSEYFSVEKFPFVDMETRLLQFLDEAKGL